MMAMWVLRLAIRSGAHDFVAAAAALRLNMQCMHVSLRRNVMSLHHSSPLAPARMTLSILSRMSAAIFAS